MAINFTEGTVQTSGSRFQVPNNYYAPDSPAFHAGRDAGHITGGQDIVFNITSLNRGGMYNTSNGRATAPVDGIYWFHVWTMDRDGNTQYTNDNLQLRRNGNTSIRDRLIVYTSSGGSHRTQRAGGFFMRMSAGDYMVARNSNAEIYGTYFGYCYYCGCLVG